MEKTIKTYFFILLTALLISGNATAINYKKLASGFVKTVFFAVTITPSSTLVHELGHASAGKALLGNPIDIALFGEPEEQTLLSVSGIKIKSVNLFDGNRMAAGLAKVPNMSKTRNHTIAITAAGPLAGMAYGISLFYFLNNPFAKYLGLCEASRHLWNLWPESLGNRHTDGYKILTAGLNIPEKNLEKLGNHRLLIEYTSIGLISAYFLHKHFLTKYISRVRKQA
jgi:hypothetical protein